jgi:hypothetical protein
MRDTNHSSRSIGELGRAIYAQRPRTLVETPENLGKEIVIDVDSGDYEIDELGMVARRRLQARRPDARCYGPRIGYNAVYSIGGSIKRTAP